MPNKQLTQTGLNRALFQMVKKLGGKVVIPDIALAVPNPDDAMLIQYHPNEKVFVFSLHKVKDNKNISSIIIPGVN